MGKSEDSRIGKVIPAKHNGTCRICGKPIAKGQSAITDMLVEAGRGAEGLVRKWVHHECLQEPYREMPMSRENWEKLGQQEQQRQGQQGPREQCPAPSGGEEAIPGKPVPGPQHEEEPEKEEPKEKEEEQQKQEQEQKLQAATLEDRVREIAREEAVSVISEVKPEITQVETTQIHKLFLPQGEVKEAKGHRHKLYSLFMRRVLRNIQVYLVGPTGCGKSHLCAQVAADLGWRFGYISCAAGTNECHVLGRLLPIEANGQFAYVTTEFVEIFEGGGLFLFDEIDGADSNMLLVLNAALSNGHMRLPARAGNPVAKRHPMCRVVAAANTYGMGADRMHEGRNPLDRATLDRFLTMELEYDRQIDQELCPGPEFAEVREQLWAMRARVQSQKPAMRRVISSRAFQLAYKDMAKGIGPDGEEVPGSTWEEYLEALLSGWTADEKARVLGEQQS